MNRLPINNEKNAPKKYGTNNNLPTSTYGIENLFTIKSFKLPIMPPIANYVKNIPKIMIQKEIGNFLTESQLKCSSYAYTSTLF